MRMRPLPVLSIVEDQAADLSTYLEPKAAAALAAAAAAAAKNASLLARSVTQAVQ